jgi:hypothetical protein
VSEKHGPNRSLWEVDLHVPESGLWSEWPDTITVSRRDPKAEEAVYQLAGGPRLPTPMRLEVKDFDEEYMSPLPASVTVHAWGGSPIPIPATYRRREK